MPTLLHFHPKQKPMSKYLQVTTTTMPKWIPTLLVSAIPFIVDPMLCWDGLSHMYKLEMVCTLYKFFEPFFPLLYGFWMIYIQGLLSL